MILHSCSAQKLEIQPCNNTTKPNRILLILKLDGVFGSHKVFGVTQVTVASQVIEDLLRGIEWVYDRRIDNDFRIGGGLALGDALTRYRD